MYFDIQRCKQGDGGLVPPSWFNEIFDLPPPSPALERK